MTGQHLSAQPDAAQLLAHQVAGIGGLVGVTVDGQAATATDGAFHAFRFGLAPEGLATRRQLSALGLRPGGAAPVASLSWRRRRQPVWAALYEIGTAKPKQPMTEAKWAALGKAMRARRTCPDCLTEGDYVISTRLGACLDCVYGPADEGQVAA